jgi:hypothetical protein
MWKKARALDGSGFFLFAERFFHGALPPMRFLSNRKSRAVNQSAFCAGTGYFL